MSKLKVLKPARAAAMGYSRDRRKRRRQHRQAAKALIDAGTFMNVRASHGSTPHALAQWHLYQARFLK